MQEQFIQDYLEAFRAANPGVAEPEIRKWSPGWYHFADGHEKFRRSKLDAMAERLRARVAQAQ